MESAQKLLLFLVHLANLCILRNMRLNAFKNVQVDIMAITQSKVVNNVIVHVRHVLEGISIVA